ncbi:MAG: hydrogenase maturation protease [Puniceicoccaceae bacterium]
MKNVTTPRIAVVGIRGTHHHDDAVGSEVIRRLLECCPPQIDAFEMSGGYLEIESAMKDHSVVIVVDSSCTGGPAGNIFWLDSHERPGCGDWFPHYAIHVSGIADSLDLALHVGENPKRLMLIGVEGKDFTDGDGLSSEVEDAVEEVLQMLELEAELVA